MRLASPLRHGFGKIGEQNGDPEPDDDLEDEAEMGAADDQVTEEQECGQRSHDLDHEHHGIAGHHPRIELAERRPDRRLQNGRIEHCRRRAALCNGFHRSPDQ